MGIAEQNAQNVSGCTVQQENLHPENVQRQAGGTDLFWADWTKVRGQFLEVIDELIELRALFLATSWHP